MTDQRHQNFKHDTTQYKRNLFVVINRVFGKLVGNLHINLLIQVELDEVLTLLRHDLADYIRYQAFKITETFLYFFFVCWSCMCVNIWCIHIRTHFAGCAYTHTRIFTHIYMYIHIVHTYLQWESFMRLRKSFQVIFSEISEGLIGYYGKFVCKHIGVYIFEYIYIYIYI